MWERCCAVQKNDYVPPRQVNPRIDKALEAVCTKAMALKVEDRYQTARGLAEDIERWLADEPVTARRDPWTEQAHRWVGRNRSLVGAVAIAAPVAIVSLSTIVAHERLVNGQLAANNSELAAANHIAIGAIGPRSARTWRSRRSTIIARWSSRTRSC